MSTRNILTTDVVLPNQYVVHTQSPRLAGQQGEVHKLVQLLHHLRRQAQQHQQGRRQQ